MKKFVLFCTTAIMSSAGYAQSTGTVETEKDTIVITGTRVQKGVDGVVLQDTTKSKGLVTQEFISKQAPGQSLLNTINLIPGVNFTQSDPYGSSGGNIRIRGFDGARVSVTFDGVPLNDSGNYAIFPNQLLDPELVEQINVNLGATDVDSPTASAAGGTVNFRSLIPTNNASVLMDMSYGTFNFQRLFGMVQTGEIGPWGTKAWFAGSRNTYNHWRGDGKIDKWQMNGKIYQPLGSNGDFVSIAGHYNQNRNNNYNNPNIGDLRTIFGSTLVPASVGTDPVVIGNYSNDQWKAINSIVYPSVCRNLTTGAPVTRPVGVNGTAQVDPGATGNGANCYAPEEPGGPGGTLGLKSQAVTNLLGTQINPSNTANIRAQSRFTLADGLLLTIDPTYQYVLANGGSQTTLLRENDDLLRQGVGPAGVDLNGDGDFLDTVLVGRPSITNTNRWTVISSLVWRINPSHTFRVAYTFDRAHHRQTGEYSYTDANFNIDQPFFGRNGRPLLSAAGTVLQNRDRTSIALLNQLSGQYIGKFVDNRLRVELGLRSPWFQRNLDQHCYTPLTGSGFPVCIVNPLALGYKIVPNTADPRTAGTKDLYAPFQAKYKYHKLLPNVGATFAVNQSLSVFASYAKGFSAPRTDNLYRSPFIGVQPETTDDYELGARYITNRFQAQGTLWQINYKNRIVTSFDPETNTSIDRNVGKARAWGFDGGILVKPIPQINLIANISYTNAKLKDDILIGTVPYTVGTGTSAANTPTAFQYFCSPLPTTGTANVQVCGKTAGKFLVETPKWQPSGRVEFKLNPVTLGVQAKHVSSRFATDVNDVKVTGYNTVDLDARVNLPFPGTRSTFQLNVINLFNEHYFGNLSTSINAFGPGNTAPRFTPVSTRAVTGTLTFGL